MKILKFNFLIGVLLLVVSQSYAQKEDNIWMLGTQISGNNCKINFSNGNADTSSVFNKLDFFLTDASICDTSGNVLFWTNGININNRNYDTLFNSENFNPGWATNYYSTSGMGIPQSLLIIPIIPNRKYYLFHESAERLLNGETQPLNLSYSEIDMNLDSTLGGITANKDHHVIDDTLAYGKLTACRHANGRDWWIITHKYNSDIYFKILVTTDTMIVMQQQVGSIVPDTSDGLGQIVFSADGNTFAYSIQNNVVDVFNFDRCTGDLTLRESFSTPDTTFGLTGCSISSNSRFLYVDNNKSLYQYDLNSVSIFNTQKLIAVWDTFFSPAGTSFFLSQLGPDNKIYISTFGGTDRLHVINQPDLQDTLCNFVQNQLILPTYNIALPNFLNYRLGALAGSACDTLHIGIDELADKKKLLKMFPNPASSMVNLIYNLSGYNKGEIVIYNAIGVKIKIVELNIHQTQQEINISMFANGIYNCILKGDNKQLDEIKLSIAR